MTEEEKRKILARALMGNNFTLAPGGPRHSGLGVKGSGYFGPIPAQGGAMTELSAEADGMEFPLVVPTLTRQELDLLSSGAPPPDAIYNKAQQHALRRAKSGQSPFADPFGLKYPFPK